MSKVMLTFFTDGLVSGDLYSLALCYISGRQPLARSIVNCYFLAYVSGYSDIAAYIDAVKKHLPRKSDPVLSDEARVVQSTMPQQKGDTCHDAR